jgi:hypothetical protein
VKTAFNVMKLRVKSGLEMAFEAGEAVAAWKAPREEVMHG